MPATELRLTPTNSADDSQGSVWGIEGNLLWVILGGAFVSLLVLLVGISILQTEWLATLIGAATPLVISVAYVGFKQRSPPGFDRDLIEFWFAGRSFGPSEPHGEIGDEPAWLGPRRRR